MEADVPLSLLDDEDLGGEVPSAIGLACREMLDVDVDQKDVCEVVEPLPLDLRLLVDVAAEA